MLDKDLIEQLNNLRAISPREQWLNDNRALLSRQIWQESKPEAGITFWSRLEYLLNTAFQPVGVAAMIFVFFVASAIFSLRLSNHTKPGDSFYLAKMISERAKLSLTFDDNSKAKLNLQFAGNRVAELSQVLADPTDIGDKQAKLDQLSQGFKQAVSNAKSSLSKNQPTVAQPVAPVTDEVFSANAGKDNTHLDISVPDDMPKSPTTPTTAVKTEDSAPVNENQTAQTALDEAEKLFDQKDYTGAAAKLDQVDKLLP